MYLNHATFHFTAGAGHGTVELVDKAATFRWFKVLGLSLEDFEGIYPHAINKMIRKINTILGAIRQEVPHSSEARLMLFPTIQRI